MVSLTVNPPLDVLSLSFLIDFWFSENTYMAELGNILCKYDADIVSMSRRLKVIFSEMSVRQKNNVRIFVNAKHELPHKRLRILSNELNHDLSRFWFIVLLVLQSF